MSSDSSEIDMIRTRITDYSDEDGAALYAYESKPAHLINLEDVLSETSYREQPKTVEDILSHCRIIYESIQNLDKKFNVIRDKVLKLHHLHMKSVWQKHKAFGFKAFRYPFSPRLKYQRAKKKSRWGFDHRRACNPTLLVMPQTAEANPEASTMEASSSYTQGALYQEQEPPLQQQNPKLRRDAPMFSPYAPLSLPPYFISEETGEDEGTSSKSFLGKGNSCSRHSSAQFPAVLAENVLPLEEQHLVSQAELMARPTSMEMKSHSQTTGAYIAALASDAGSSVGTDPSISKLSCVDPSAWSVEEAILYLKQSFAENLGPLAGLFREHGIDGEALLLLTCDIMLKYMDIKLGPALKVYSHIKRLKEKKYFGN